MARRWFSPTQATIPEILLLNSKISRVCRPLWARGRCWDTGLKKASEAVPAASQLENQHIRKRREKHHWQYEQERGHSDGGGII